MKKINLIIAGMIFMFSGMAYSQEQSTATAEINTSTDIPVYEYKSKVIIEGKWGKAEGEFGRQSEVDYDLKPESMAVDSKGNIYILDFVNNRIQKFDNSGKYLKSIEIEGLKGPIYCWAELKYNPETKQEERYVGDSPEKPTGVPEEKLIPYVWPPEVQGVNIVIDSKDTLYYYLKTNKNGKETGEVWEFENDKLVKKKRIEAKGIASVNSARYLPSDVDPIKDWVYSEQVKEEGKGNFNAISKDKRNFKFSLPDNFKFTGGCVYNKKKSQWEIGVNHSGKMWTRFYNSQGELIKEEEYAASATSDCEQTYGDINNYFCVKLSNDKFIVVKYELVRVK